MSCTRPPHWLSEENVAGRHIRTLLEGDSIETLSRNALPEEIPDIPIRTKLRPCCAFGNNLKIRVGALPIPGFRIGNIMSLEELGSHIYDSGAFTISSSQGVARRDRSRERNGLIYTCRGGFIDTAHVRD